MNIHLVFSSSYSSQLGSLISIKKYLSDYSHNLDTTLILVFQIATRSDPKAKFSPYDLISNIKELNLLRVARVPINNILSRLLLLVVLPVFIFPLSIFHDVYVWEPRPQWVNSLFSFKGIKLPFLFPRHTRILFGDGFLSYCGDSKPFWLEKGNRSRFCEDVKGGYYSLFYYLYNISHNNPTYLDVKIDPRYIYSFIFELLESCSNNSDFIAGPAIANSEATSCFRDLYIFPTTTFSETFRSSFDDEISMYVDFIREHVPVGNSWLLIKPHPGYCSDKTITLKHRLLSLGYLMYDHTSSSYSNSLLSLPLDVIPLEVLYLLLIKDQYKIFRNIHLVVCSTASLSCLLIYPEIDWKCAFGSILINKYLNPEYRSSRLVQENKLIEHLYKI